MGVSAARSWQRSSHLRSPEVSRQHRWLPIRKHPVWLPEPRWACCRDQGGRKEGLQEPGMGCATCLAGTEPRRPLEPSLNSAGSDAPVVMGSLAWVLSGTQGLQVSHLDLSGLAEGTSGLLECLLCAWLSRLYLIPALLQQPWQSALVLFNVCLHAGDFILMK